MTDQSSSAKRWNLFARELEDILTAHHLSIGQLDDRFGIHREKVRRLQRSLLIPKSFPVLNTREMEQLIKQVSLSDSEIVRLQAAILAAAIEMLLMDRINQDDALLAAEQLLPTISDALQQSNSITGIGAVRREDTIPSNYDESDLGLEAAIEHIEKGTIALHLSYNVSSHRERIERSKEAHSHFEVALAELEKVDDDLHMLVSWRYYQAEAHSRLTETKERLEDLGE